MSKTWTRRTVALAISAGLASVSCAGFGAGRPDVMALVPEHPFGERPVLTSVDAIHALSAEQERHFLRYFHAVNRKDIEPHARVRDYLVDLTQDFSYAGRTLTAREAFATKSGNCLSLAVLTTALAELARVEVGYEVVDSAPVFEWKGSVIYRGVHVRTVLYDPEWKPPVNEMILRRPGIRIDYFPDPSDRFVSTIDRSAYAARFYDNLAAEAVRTGDLSRAYWLLREALRMNPDDAIAANTLAVVFRRVGDESAAERIYLHGIDHLTNKVSFLWNYRVLLRQQGRESEIRRVERRLAKLDADNPIDWVIEGRNAYARSEFVTALILYKKAVKAAPYLEEAHLGLARTYDRLDKKSLAEHALRKAIELARESDRRSLYQRKLMALQRAKR